MTVTKVTIESCRGRDRGFTIVELLIALFLAGIITSVALAIYVTQHRQLLVEDDVSDMQANIRAAAVELTTQIRMAGYNVPEGVPGIECYDTNPDTIVVTFEAGNLEDVRVEDDMPTPSAELRCGGHDLKGIYDGDWLFIYDPNTRTGEYFQVTQVKYGSGQLQHKAAPLSKAYPAGSRVYRMIRFKYYIDYSDSLHPNLVLSSPGCEDQVCAENITDLNVRYVLKSGAVVDVFPSADMVSEVIVELDARAAGEQDEFHAPRGKRELTARAEINKARQLR